MWIEARIHMFESDEAADQQARATQQNHGESGFGDDERITKKIVTRAMAGAAAAFFQNFADAELRKLQSGRDAEKNGRSDRRNESESEHARIERRSFDARNNAAGEMRKE